MTLPFKYNLLGRNFGLCYLLLRIVEKKLIFTCPLFGEETLSV